MQSTQNPATLRELTVVYTLAHQPNTHKHTHTPFQSAMSEMKL